MSKIDSDKLLKDIITFDNIKNRLQGMDEVDDDDLASVIWAVRKEIHKLVGSRELKKKPKKKSSIPQAGKHDNEDTIKMRDELREKGYSLRVYSRKLVSGPRLYFQVKSIDKTKNFVAMELIRVEKIMATYFPGVRSTSGGFCPFDITFVEK